MNLARGRAIGSESGASIGLTSVLLWAMAGATFTASSLSIIGSFVIETFEISHAGLGLVVTVNTVLAGLLSPAAGRLADRVGGGHALRILFLVSGLTFALIAIAPTYLFLLAAAVVGSVAQSLANPSTNKVIATVVAPGRRADITGIKQSGVHLAFFIGGLGLPTLSRLWGWRVAMALVGAVVVVGAAAIGTVVRVQRGDSAPVDARGGRVPTAVKWLAGYGLLLGFSGSALFFVALYVEEDLGSTPQVGGIAVAVIGLVAIFGRIIWARFAERRSAYRLSLGTIALLTIGGMLLMLSADTPAVSLWLAAVVIGASSSSWNSVGMLAVMEAVPADEAGVASGWVLAGFLVGLGAAPPIYGWTYDVSGSYTTMWVLAAVFAAAAAIVIAVWTASNRPARLRRS